MKKLLLILLFTTSSLFCGTGEIGSKNESFQVMLKIELIKEDNSLVTILDGTKFLELKTDGNSTSLAEELEAVRPANGIYKGIKYTAYKFKRKVKIVSGATTYYTRDKNISIDTSFDLSTNINDYAYTTVTLANDVTTIMFPKKLIIDDGSDSSIVWINKYVANKVTYETDGTIENSTHIGEEELATTFLPELPSKTVVIDVNYTKTSEANLTNKITVFVDDNDSLLGAFMYRPTDDKALNGSNLLSGTNTANNFFLRFKESNDNSDENDYFDVNVTLDTTGSTYSNLVINEIKDGGTPATAKPNNQDGYDLSTSGSIVIKGVNSLSFETGFTSIWLDGKILYNVYQNLENGDVNNSQWSNNKVTTMKFEKGKLYLAEGISQNYLATFDFSISSEGLITYFDDYNHDNDPNFQAKQRWIHFNSQNDDLIEICYSSDKQGVLGCTSSTKNHEVFFLDKDKAKTAYENANFFDYMNTSNKNNNSPNTESLSSNIQFDSNYLNGKTFYILYHIKDGLFEGQIIGKHDFTDTQITWTQIYRKNTSWGSNFLESGVDNYTSNNNALDVTRVKYTNENGEQNPQHSFTMTLKDKIGGYDGKSFIENANGYEFELYMFNSEEEARNYLSYLDNLQ